MRFPLEIRPLTIAHAEMICTWRYPAPYDIFNFDDWLNMVVQQVEFGDPELRKNQYASIIDTNEELVGYVQYFPLIGVTRLGLGIRPDLCSFGYGPAFVHIIVEEAKKREPLNEIDLEVLDWNSRAISTYLKSGFVWSDTYERLTPSGFKTFHCMVYHG